MMLEVRHAGFAHVEENILQPAPRGGEDLAPQQRPVVVRCYTQGVLVHDGLCRLIVLRFQWNPDKAAANLEKHDVSFEEAATAVADPLSLPITDPDHS